MCHWKLGQRETNKNLAAALVDARVFGGWILAFIVVVFSRIIIIFWDVSRGKAKERHNNNRPSSDLFLLTSPCFSSSPMAESKNCFVWSLFSPLYAYELFFYLFFRELQQQFERSATGGKNEMCNIFGSQFFLFLRV
jgi:hypothetical protein